MKVLVDAQLPKRLARLFHRAGHDAIHTLDLPSANRTPDGSVTAIVNHDGRVLVTKDADFVNSYLVSRRPAKLLLVSTGNISNDELERIVSANLRAIEAAFGTNDFVELTRTNLVVHS